MSGNVSVYPYTYEAAREVLNGARNVAAGRPLANNTRLVACEVDGLAAVGVKLHRTIVVAYVADGTITLNSGGWRTVTTQARINDFSPARVYSRIPYNVRGEKVSEYPRWLVTSDVLGTSPAKIQKCRACKGTGWKEPWVETKRWTGTAYVDLEEPVVHEIKCYRCDGAGERDYGSHHVYASFEDGVRIDANGRVLGFGHLPIETYGAERLRLSRFEYRHHSFTSSPDSESVRFKEVSDAAHAEMLEWMGILKKEGK